MIQRISSGQNFTDILNLRCDLDLKRSNPIFFHRTLRLITLLSNQVWLQTDQQFKRYNRIVIFWLYKLSPWPWHWTEWTNFSAWHSGSQCCITTPGLETKYLAVQKISTGKTFTNILSLRCDLDLERSNPIFPQDTPAYDGVLSNQVWLQMDQHFRRYSKK